MKEHSHQFKFESHKEKEMADFRKLLLALVAGALLFTTVASADPYSCRATAVPTLVRSEGLAEMMGDVLLLCSGDVPSGGILANIRLRLTQNITSDMESSPKNEALLVLDEGLTATGLKFYGPGTSAPPYIQNLYQASRISDDEIEWAGVWLAAPSSNPYKIIRLTNVRGNAQGAGSFGTIFATVNIVSPTSVPVDNAVLRVADTRPGMSFAVTSQGYKNCETPSATMALKFTEGFASAFKRKGDAATEDNTPGGAYLTESGFNPGSLLITGTLAANTTVPGQANYGTRLMARFKNVPSGVTLSVPKQVTTSSGMVVQLVDSPDADGGGGTVTTGTGSVNVPSSGLVVYEVVTVPALSYSTQETVTVTVSASYSIPGPLGTATANGNLAPISTVTTSSSSAYEPRFVDTASDSTIMTIGPCRTILLFPYVTNQAGFDTGIAISNTSRDPLGTTNQSGACTLYYYGNTNGSTGPTSQTTPAISAGSHFAMMLSGGGGVFNYNGTMTACSAGNCVAPLFQGYVFAICDFQFAHGYAFISDVGASKLAQGYLALVVPDRGTSAGSRKPEHSSTASGANTGEQLGN